MSATIVTDALVVGSGAGGLSAAVTARLLGLDVIVVEKEPLFGGASARSGGWLWIPCSPQARAAGVDDSLDEARRYLQHEAANHFDGDRVDAFLVNGPEMVSFLESNTAVRFILGPAFSDYHPDAPGAKPGGRSIVAEPFDGRELGAEIKRLRPPLPELTFLGMMIGSGKELLHFFNVTRSIRSAGYVGLLLARYARDLARHGRAMRLTNGNALIGRLARSALDLGIPIRTSSGLRDLIRRDGRVVGGVVDTPSGPVEIHARRGVVLASGGFPRNVERRKALYPHAPTGLEHDSPAPPGNTGDGLELAERIGASVISDFPNPAAWAPVSRVPRRDGTVGLFPHFIDRAKPGVIAVTPAGHRFVNEANSYHDFMQGLFRSTPKGDVVRAFLITDHPTLRRYGLGFVKPFPVPLAPYLGNGYLKKGRTLRALADAAGIAPDALETTLEAYNESAAKGTDPAFGRGTTAYNRYLGDPSVTPNPCVAPIENGPFYAVEVVPGELGTFAGIRCDAHARVLDESGAPIDGLYAAGNDAASIMGGNYPGGGITLGPAMTFGYIAAKHMSADGPARPGEEIPPP